MDKEKDLNRPENMPEDAQNQEETVKRFYFRRIIPQVKPGYILRKVGQAYMVMPTGPRMKEYEGMITLNETGAFLFKEAQKPECSKEKLMDACKAEYGATDEEALQAADSFIQQCADCGIFDYEEIIVEGDEAVDQLAQTFGDEA